MRKCLPTSQYISLAVPGAAIATETPPGAQNTRWTRFLIPNSAAAAVVLLLPRGSSPCHPNSSLIRIEKFNFAVFVRTPLKQKFRAGCVPKIIYRQTGRAKRII
jgi:hypothetical protein